MVSQRVKFRHKEASQLTTKAQQQNTIRQQQMVKIRQRSKQAPPPAVGLLGCWQIIEMDMAVNLDPGRIADFDIGDEKIFITALTPDDEVFGESVCRNRMVLDGPHAGRPIPGPLYCALSGEVTGDNTATINSDPKGDREFSGNTFFNPNFNSQFGANASYRMRLLPTVLHVAWEGWQMEGELYAKDGRVEYNFTAVRLEEQVWI